MTTSRKKIIYVLIHMFFFANASLIYSQQVDQIITCDNDYIEHQTVQCEYQLGTDKHQKISDNNDNIVIQSNIILPDRVLAGGSVIIENGKIKDVVCGKVEQPRYNKLTCYNTVLSPAFINSHEHLAHSYVPAKKIVKQYQHRDDWRFNKYKSNDVVEPEKSHDMDILNWVELRHLLSGTTTVASSPPYGNIVKHHQNHFLKTMPFGKDTVKAFDGYMADNCLDQNTTCPNPFIVDNKDNIPHIGEGVGKLANTEIKAYLKAILYRKDNLKYSFIHAIAADDNDLKLMINNDISLVWSLSSNQKLYGATAEVKKFYQLGGNIAISTDWSLSGTLNMLEEINFVRNYNLQELNSFFSDQQIWQMATVNGAKAIGIEHLTGAIQPNLSADLILVPRHSQSYYQSVLDNQPKEIMAIWKSGELQAASKEIISANSNFLNACTQKITKNNYLCLSKDKLNYEKLLSANKNNLPAITE